METKPTSAAIVVPAASGQWNSKWEYILSCVSYGVGLGNLWRFPYLVFQNGGMTFIIPYWICLLFCGLPLCVFEGCLGQMTGLTNLKLWQTSDWLAGLGWGQVLMCYICNIYYAVIIAYALLFVYYSPSMTFADDSDFCSGKNQTITSGNTSCQEEFYKYKILNNPSGLSDYVSGLGEVNYPLALALAVVWMIMFIALRSSTSSAGKLSYITAIFPYICLTALLVSSTMQSGSEIGVAQYFQVDLKLLLESKIWIKAAEQIFYSQGPAWGCLIIYAARNSYTTDVYAQAWRVSIINGLTSFFAGLVVFSTLGALAYRKAEKQITAGNYDMEITELASNHSFFNAIVKSGPELAFIVYPAALALMPAASYWSILFFLMLMTLGIGTLTGLTMTITESLADLVPVLKSNYKAFLGAVILLHYIPAYPMLTANGGQWFAVFDYYCCTLTLCIFGLLSTTFIVVLSSTEEYIDNVERMLGYSLPGRKLWGIVWKVVTPTYIGAMIIMSLKTSVDKKFSLIESAPAWVNAIGWSLPGSQLVLTALVSGWFVWKRRVKLKNNTETERIFRILARRRFERANSDESELFKSDSSELKSDSSDKELVEQKIDLVC